jgi:hypothetical protein
MRFLPSTGNAPIGEVPIELRKAWLRFHEEKWCRGVDAVFVFDRDGMEAWCLVEDDGSYQRFTRMLAPLRANYEVELYTTYTTREEKQKSKDPPPSLWNNLELRAFLGDPFLVSGVRRDHSVYARDVIAGRRDFFLKQRMTLFAAETLEWMRHMRRHGSCLPSLTAVAFDPGGGPELRGRATAICRDHAREIEKNSGKIRDNMIRALPKLPKGSGGGEPVIARPSDRSAREEADQIKAHAQSVAQSVYRFFYPRNHAVRIGDLKDPHLLDSLKSLRRMTALFRKSLEG